MGAIATVFGILWMFGSAWVTSFVDDIVNKKQLAPAAEVQQLDRRVDQLESGDRSQDISLTKQGEKLENIEELLREQRGDIKTILRFWNNRIDPRDTPQ